MAGKENGERVTVEKAQWNRNPNPNPKRDGSFQDQEGLVLTAPVSMAASSPSPPEAAPAPDTAADEDEWDVDGFVIPDLSTQDGGDVTGPSVPRAMDPEPPMEKEEKIYLGPHGSPPSQSKQQELNTISRKQRFRNKLKEADRKPTGNAQENKVESLRELMGARTDSVGMQKSSRRDWLDPHCHESEFDRKSHSGNVKW